MAVTTNSSRSGFLLNDRISRRDASKEEVRPAVSQVEEADHGEALSDEELRSREAARLASIVLNMKELNSEQPNKHQQQKKKKATEALHISPGTLSRVRMAKAKLELEYQMIQNFQDLDYEKLAKSEPDKAINLSDMHSSSEEEQKPRGKYNPLQTIRNRAQRPVTSPFGASRHSNHHLASHESRKSAGGGLSTWKVDPAELVADYGWQQRNWHVMRNRYDKLVYQPERPGNYSPMHSPQASLSKHEELISRLKTKLSSHVHRHDSSDSSFSETDMIASTPQSPRSLSEDKTFQVIDQRNRSISPVRNVNIESIQSRVFPQSEAVRERRVSITAPVLQHPDISRLRRENLNGALEPAQPISESAVIDEEPGADEKKEHVVVAESPAPSEVSYSNAKEMKYLDMVFFLSHMHVLNGSLSRNGSTTDLMDTTKRQCDEMSSAIDTTTSRALSELVPRTRDAVSSHEKTIRNLHEDLSQVKAPQMDRVLVTSDKIIGEVSTTLNLEMRKIGERLDRVALDTPSVEWVRVLAYWMLEWVLVIIMWIAWAFFSVIGLAKSSVALIFFAIRWLLWY
ncbi:hypothetical protein TRVA0_006S03466 [Trichomonascus vanleenenianus]|uniref:Mtc4p n=1 Tax=Trichomonascus vanleenenianus TaxID=2268995 RepID=UPI003ECB6314